MALISRPARIANPGGGLGARFVRLAVAMPLCLALLVGASACGLDVQTLHPYTPADGVSTEAGTVQIRNLMVLSRTAGQGFLSASLVSTDHDELVAVSGTPVKADGSDGTAFTASTGSPVTLANNQLVVLTDRAAIDVQSPDLKPGLTVKLVLQFSGAGQVNLTVPVIDASLPTYASVTPSAAATPAG